MDIATLGSCVAIVMICYIVGLGCKAAKKVPDEWIPVIMAVVGGILGAAGMGVIPDFRRRTTSRRWRSVCSMVWRQQA